MFVPTDYNGTSGEHPLKRIMIPHGMAEAKVGPDIFFQQRCPVNTCTIVRDNPDDADLILFKDYIAHVGRRPHNQVCNGYATLMSILRHRDASFAGSSFCSQNAKGCSRLPENFNREFHSPQVWMLYFLECPYHTQSVKNALINWTATYRRDSDVVAPYERWQYYDSSVTQIPQTFNYAANKTKKVMELNRFNNPIA